MSKIKCNIERRVNQQCWERVYFNVIKYIPKNIQEKILIKKYTPRNIQEKIEVNVYSLIWRNVFGIVEENITNNILEVMVQNIHSGKYIYYNKSNILKAFK